MPFRRKKRLHAHAIDEVYVANREEVLVTVVDGAIFSSADLYQNRAFPGPWTLPYLQYVTAFITMRYVQEERDCEYAQKEIK